MIPVSLQLKNFLSYGEEVPALDFTEFDVACLSGENGHGKSAILDAITWALWGEARKASADKTPSDGLLRIGATDMQVEFVFDLEGDRYRVLRKYQRKKGKAGSPSLEFQIFDGASQTYKSVSERTVKNTQEKITQTLRMSYETFINSAFILQGHIDEFTRRSPTQRKTILADILDLSRYEALRELARDHTSAAKNERDTLGGQIAVKAEEVKHKGEYARKLEELREVLTEVDGMLSEHEQRKQTLEQQRMDLQAKQQQLDDRRDQQQRLRQECQQLDQRIARQEQQLAETQAILRNEGEILTQYKRYSSLQTKSASYEEKRRQLTTLQEQQRAVEQTIRQTQHEREKTLEKRQSEQTQLHAQLSDLQHTLDRSHEIEQGFQELQSCRDQEEQFEQRRNRVAEIEHAMRDVELQVLQHKTRLEGEIHSVEQQYAEVQRLANLETERKRQVERQTAELARLTALERERDVNKETGMQCGAQIEGLKAQQQRLQQDLTDLREKIDLLKRSAQPQCPLCQSALEPEKKQEIDAHFQQEITRIYSEIRRVEQELQTHNTRIQELRDQFKRLEKQIKQGQPVREQLIHAEHALLESQQAAACLPALLKQTTTLRARLQDNAYAPDEQRQLTALQEAKTAIGYDPQAHQRLKQTIKTLQKFQGDYSRLEDTRARQQKYAAQLPDIDRRIAELRDTLARQAYAQTERGQLHAILAHIQELGYDAQAHADIQQELRQLQQAPTQKAQLDQAQKSAGSLRQEMDHRLSERLQKAEQLADLNKRLVELEQDLEKLPAIVQELRDHNEALHEMRKKRDALLQEQGTYQHKHERCQALEREMATEQDTFNRWQKDVRIYEHLAKMFGKDGIQAYLIDHAIPEIEEEANVILSRLSDNRMRIAIESVKDLQSGGSKETLDIKISDEVGTRHYEMYSGGEAFRVDFAIRVALSKLLATRAGTQLRTLVIDEGFGTQDARGLEQLVEAIKAISSDFEKILVITHLDALKEAFPVRIEVVKLPDTGSQYQIVH